jgi:hypothetical protein
MTLHTTPSTGCGPNRWRLAAWAGVFGLILLPFAAMQFTDEVVWTAFDFIWFASLLIGAGVVLELLLWQVRRPLWRWLIAAVVVGAVLLIWADGAVGIF